MKQKTKADLYREIERMRVYGTLMSNVCFNLSQTPGRVVTEAEQANMRDLYKSWDREAR